MSAESIDFPLETAPVPVLTEAASQPDTTEVAAATETGEPIKLRGSEDPSEAGPDELGDYDDGDGESEVGEPIDLQAHRVRRAAAQQPDVHVEDEQPEPAAQDVEPPAEPAAEARPARVNRVVSWLAKIGILDSLLVRRARGTQHVFHRDRRPADAAVPSLDPALGAPHPLVEEAAPAPTEAEIEAMRLAAVTRSLAPVAQERLLALRHAGRDTAEPEEMDGLVAAYQQHLDAEAQKERERRAAMAAAKVANLHERVGARSREADAYQRELDNYEGFLVHNHRELAAGESDKQDARRAEEEALKIIAAGQQALMEAQRNHLAAHERAVAAARRLDAAYQPHHADRAELLRQMVARRRRLEAAHQARTEARAGSAVPAEQSN